MLVIFMVSVNLLKVILFIMIGVFDWFVMKIVVFLMFVVVVVVYVGF